MNGHFYVCDFAAINNTKPSLADRFATGAVIAPITTAIPPPKVETSPLPTPEAENEPPPPPIATRPERTKSIVSYSYTLSGFVTWGDISNGYFPGLERFVILR